MMMRIYLTLFALSLTTLVEGTRVTHPSHNLPISPSERKTETPEFEVTVNENNEVEVDCDHIPTGHSLINIVYDGHTIGDLMVKDGQVIVHTHFPNSLRFKNTPELSALTLHHKGLAIFDTPLSVTGKTLLTVPEQCFFQQGASFGGGLVTTAENVIFKKGTYILNDANTLKKLHLQEGATLKVSKGAKLKHHTITGHTQKKNDKEFDLQKAPVILSYGQIEADTIRGHFQKLTVGKAANVSFKNSHPHIQTILNRGSLTLDDGYLVSDEMRIVETGSFHSTHMSCDIKKWIHHGHVHSKHLTVHGCFEGKRGSTMHVSDFIGGQFDDYENLGDTTFTGVGIISAKRGYVAGTVKAHTACFSFTDSSAIGQRARFDITRHLTVRSEQDLSANGAFHISFSPEKDIKYTDFSPEAQKYFHLFQPSALFSAGKNLTVAGQQRSDNTPFAFTAGGTFKHENGRIQGGHFSKNHIQIQAKIAKLRGGPKKSDRVLSFID